jgi:hypothetical protein
MAGGGTDVEDMRCNNYVHIINVMMTPSRKVRSGTHIAVHGFSIKTALHLIACLLTWTPPVLLLVGEKRGGAALPLSEGVSVQ